MKNRLLAVLLLILLFSFCSCFAFPKDEISVTFDLGNGTKETRIIKTNEPIVYPSLPTIENYAHVGWFYDSDGKRPVGENATLDADTTLYSLWMYDYAGVTNEICTDYIRMNLLIKATSFNTRFGLVVSELTSVGSGVIFAEDASYYYCLTNQHVAEKKSGYESIEISVEDCYGNEYGATVEYYDSSYDLAVLRFRKGKNELRVATLADVQCDVGDIVINLGQPEGVKNAVTYGHVTGYDKLVSSIDGKEKSDVDFEVMCHNAPINHGSSGGAVLNDALELVGINFAVGEDADKKIIYAYSIPLDKIREFLKDYKAK